MTQFVKCKALVAFTEFVPGYGQLHMNPDDEECAEGPVPAQIVGRLVEDNRVEVIEDVLDHDGDGTAGGSRAQSGDEVTALRAEYKAKFGRNPFNGWDADTLREKIAAPAQGDGTADDAAGTGAP